MDTLNENLLIEKWNALVDARDAFLLELNQFNPDDVSLAPPSGGWSALQVLEHLLASETGTLGYMRKKTSSGWESLEVAEEKHLAAAEALRSRLQSGDRYSAPAILAEPQGLEPIGVMLERWENLRAEMEQFVFSLDEEYYDRLIFRQPAAGLLRLFDTLDFLRYHLEHHIPQLQRIRASLPE